MLIAAPATIQIPLRIFLRRFIGGFLEVESELLDQLLEPDRVPAGGIVVGPVCCEPFVHPLARGGIGDRSNVGRNLGGLLAHGGRTEHDRQTTIEPVAYPKIECQTRQHPDGHGKRRTERPPRGQGSDGPQRLVHRRQHATTKLGGCAPGRHLMEPALDLIVHFLSFTI
jgi:hypothetical protein